MANEEEAVDKLANEAEREARSMQKGAEDLGEKVKETRSDWNRKHQDDSVRGAAPPDGEKPDVDGDEPGDEALG